MSTTYNAWFRALGSVAAVGGAWVVRVEPIPAEEKSPLSTRFLAANVQKPDAEGKFEIKRFDLTAWGVGWVPTALVISLIAATRLPMRRRFASLLWGLLLINLYIAFCIRVCLWDETADLFNLGPLARSISGALSYSLVTQMGAGFAVPVLIWLAVTFRAHDARLLTSTLAEASPPRKAKRPEH
ncbi:MAG: hypothetical protein WC003_08605 [Terrimicrobiaceae bacterium]